MSIESQIRKVKQEVKCYGFWRKTSTATTKEVDPKQKLQQNEARLLDIKARQTKLMATSIPPKRTWATSGSSPPRLAAASG